MDKDTTYVALDDSKRTLVVGILRPGSLEPELREIPNESKLLRRLIERLKREGPVRVCYEAGVSRYDLYRHVLREHVLRLGPAAAAFEAGLVAAHGGAAGYHLARLLALAERVGAPRVAEALRHAVRYGAFDYPAVARIVAGQPDLPRGAPAAPGPLPQHLHEYLRGVGQAGRT